jgi:hypothetical protein
LAQAHSDVRYAGFASVSKKKRQAAKQQLDPAHVATLARLAVEEGVATVLYPVNFGDWHWACIYIAVQLKKIFYYDSKNVCMKLLDDLVQGLTADDTFADYVLVKMNNPFQQDGFSCGLFVCHKFWRHIDKTFSNDMSPSGLCTKRLEILHFVLRGVKISVDRQE